MERIHRKTVSKKVSMIQITTMVTHPVTLESDVKRAVGSITTNKASRGDGIPADLFQILKDDAVNMLHSM